LVFDSLSLEIEVPRNRAVLAAADLVLELCGTSSLVAQQLAANSLRAMHHQQIHLLLQAAWHAMRSSDAAVKSVSGTLLPSSAGALRAILSDREMAMSIATSEQDTVDVDDLAMAIVRLYEYTQDTLSARINQATGDEVQEVIELIQGFNAAAVLATRIVGRISEKNHHCGASIDILTRDFRECFPLGDTWGEPFLDSSKFGKPGSPMLLGSRT
jgi:flagellin-specific chaperone FliS